MFNIVRINNAKILFITWHGDLIIRQLIKNESINWECAYKEVKIPYFKYIREALIHLLKDHARILYNKKAQKCKWDNYTF